MTVKERPILFTGPMVRAILDGRKTQTRRICKQKASPYGDRDDLGWPMFQDGYGDWHHERCPYGQPGDRLWVRETWGYTGVGIWSVRDAQRWQDKSCVVYKADTDCDMTSGWFPSIHMPRWASRILLEITDVRVERVQDIFETDCPAEGVVRSLGGMWCGAEHRVHGEPKQFYTARDAFADLWDSINAKRGYGWGSDPWVWVIEFKRVEVK